MNKKTINESKEKILYKAFRSNLFDGIIESILKNDTNKFTITTYAFYKNPINKVVDTLIKIGFCENKESIRIIKQYRSKIDTWNCLITELEFMDWNYELY